MTSPAPQGWALQPWAQALIAQREWERETIAHLLDPAPCDCQIHQDYRASQRPMVRTARERKITPADVVARTERNQAELDRTIADLDAFLCRNASRNDPAVVNAPLHNRPGAITNRKLDEWSRLTTRRDRLQHKIALDRARLERMTA